MGLDEQALGAPNGARKGSLSWPKSLLSSRASGIAAQLIATKDFAFLVLARWMAFAISSFPVPLSPWM